MNPYFPYSGELDPSWRCSFCREEDPRASGGLIAHKTENLADGAKHPIHRYCAILLHVQSPLCPDCRVTTDLSDLLTLSDKIHISATQLIDRVRKVSPIERLYTGWGLICLAGVMRQPLLGAVGMSVQAYTLRQMNLHGGRNIALARKIEHLTQEIVTHRIDQRFILKKLGEIKTRCEGFPHYHLQVAALTQLKNRDEIVGEALKVQKVFKQEIRNDLILRCWILFAYIGTLYFGLKSLR